MAFETSRSELTARDHLTLVGQTLFLSGSNLLAKWQPRLAAFTTNAFTELPSNRLGWVTVTCDLPAGISGTNLHDALTVYFDEIGSWLWPPWVEQPALNESQKHDAAMARYTWTKFRKRKRRSEKIHSSSDSTGR